MSKQICLQIYNWVPDFYDDINDLPKDMPDDLVDYIKNVPKSNVSVEKYGPLNSIVFIQIRFNNYTVQRLGNELVL